MKIKCPKCGNLIQSKIGDYQYKESGLDNVFLENIPVYDCSCGISFASIFRVSMLNDLISETLLKKPTLLSGKEIRFLRKSLYISSKDFARILDIGKTTLSKWENDTQRHRKGYDKFIRLLYLLYKEIKGKEKRDFLKIFDRIQLKETDVDYIITVAKEGDDYVVNRRPILSGQGQKLPIVWIFSKTIFWSVADRINFALDISQTKSGKMFSSPETISTCTANRMVKWHEESQNSSTQLFVMT